MLLLDRIDACKGGGLVLDGDLSMQLMVSGELQALVRDAGLPVELLFDFDRPCPMLSQKVWMRLDVPVCSTTWPASRCSACESNRGRGHSTDGHPQPPAHPMQLHSMQPQELLVNGRGVSL